MKEKIETKKRLIQFDLLRILAIFFMMLLHIAGSNWDWTAVDSFEWNTFNVYDSIARCCVPIFVMISGMFFLNDDRIEPIGYIYKKTDCYRHCEWTLPFMVCPYDDRIIYGSTFFEKNMF